MQIAEENLIAQINSKCKLAAEKHKYKNSKRKQINKKCKRTCSGKGNNVRSIE
jgi:hypothetical protein